MKSVTLLFWVTLIVSCRSSLNEHDRKFYTNVTQMEIPDDSYISETYDNGDGVTATSFKIDSILLTGFIDKYKLQVIGKDKLQVIGKDKSVYLSLPAQAANSIFRTDTLPKKYDDNIFCLEGEKGKDYWLCFADLKRRTLWIIICYPGWADGN